MYLFLLQNKHLRRALELSTISVVTHITLYQRSQRLYHPKLHTTSHGTESRPGIGYFKTTSPFSLRP